MIIDGGNFDNVISQETESCSSRLRSIQPYWLSWFKKVSEVTVINWFLLVFSICDTYHSPEQCDCNKDMCPTMLVRLNYDKQTIHNGYWKTDRTFQENNMKLLKPIWKRISSKPTTSWYMSLLSIWQIFGKNEKKDFIAYMVEKQANERPPMPKMMKVLGPLKRI